MRVGVFGGAFDPLHIGHLIVADDAAVALQLDRVIFIPAGTHPLKRSEVEAPGELRLAMVESCVRESERFVSDDRELRREGPSYTVDTLRELRAEHPAAQLHLLVGSDILKEFDEWHAVEEISALARIVVMRRAGVEAPAPDELRLDFDVVEVTRIDISSTEVRRRVRNGLPFRYLVPVPVYRIIVEHSLYKGQDSTGT